MVQMACLVMLLGNFVGGLLSTVLHAFEQPAPERKYIQKPSFRLFVIGMIVFISVAVYFHSMVKTQITNWEYGYWIATGLMAPMFAIAGSQISKIALADKLAWNRTEWQKIEAKQKAKAAEQKSSDKTLDDETAGVTKLKDDSEQALDDEAADVTKLEEEELEAFDDSMNITNVKD